jgi:hypothetical protein
MAVINGEVKFPGSSDLAKEEMLLEPIADTLISRDLGTANW